MKRVMIMMVAALLAACSKKDSYPVPLEEAYATVTGAGLSEATRVPAAFDDVSVDFQSTPDDHSAVWNYTVDGKNVGKIMALVTPDGDNASQVEIGYMDGDAESTPRIKVLRAILGAGQVDLVHDAVQAGFQGRAPNADLRKGVELAALQSSMGKVMDDVSKSMDEYASKSSDREKEYRAHSEQSRVGKPTVGNTSPY